MIGFGAGEPDFPTPADVVDAAVKACNDPRNYKYTPTAGLPELREAIAAKVLRDSGYEVTADQVVVTNGGKQAVYESFQVLLNDGDEVIIPTPFWTSYPEAVKLAGGKPVEVFAGATAVSSPTSPPSRPLGPSARRPSSSLPRTTRPVPCGVARRSARSASGPWSTTCGSSPTRSTSTSTMTAQDRIRRRRGPPNAATSCWCSTASPRPTRCRLASWLDGRPRARRQAVAKLQGHLSSNVSNVPQRAALAAVAGSLDEVHMMRESFDARRKAIVAALNDIPGVHCPTPTGAFYAFPDVTGLLGKPLGENGTVVNTSSELAAALLDEAHVAAVPGEAFGAPGYLRFSYALADDQLAEGMRRFRRWVG